MHLPIPSEIAQAHSLRLQENLAARGLITFCDYMQSVLYEPGLGYYSAGAHKFGEGGDFITAPEISPLFGMTIGQSLLPIIEELDSPNWLELGAGTGKLAVSIMRFLAEQKKLPMHYFILDVSADLKERQQSYLRAELSEDIFNRIVWLNGLPETFEGIIIANEVLDAFPIHRFKITENGPQEIFVSAEATSSNTAFTFHETLKDPSSSYLQNHINTLIVEAAQKGMALNIGYESEINLHQEALLKSLSVMLNKGVILFIDYGFPAREYYHPDRQQGTLMCHYQHHAHTDPYFWPGLQDITAHVDFTALAKCGIENGLTLETFTTQGAWLMYAGIIELAQERLPEEKSSPLSANAIRKLISPEEMGEVFKMILFSKSLSSPTPGFVVQIDQRHRL